MPVAPRTSRGTPVDVVERGPQLTDRVVEAGPRGPFGDAQGRRDLRERIPQVVVQDDDRPLFRVSRRKACSSSSRAATDRAMSGSTGGSRGMTRTRAIQRRSERASA